MKSVSLAYSTLSCNQTFTEAGPKLLNIVLFTREHRNTQTDLLVLPLGSLV